MRPGVSHFAASTQGPSIKNNEFGLDKPVINPSNSKSIKTLFPTNTG